MGGLVALIALALANAADFVVAKIGAILPVECERQLVHVIADIFRPKLRYTAIIDLAPLRSDCWCERHCASVPSSSMA